jgi:hypothetical protein
MGAMNVGTRLTSADKYPYFTVGIRQLAAPLKSKPKDYNASPGVLQILILQLDTLFFTPDSRVNQHLLPKKQSSLPPGTCMMGGREVLARGEQESVSNGNDDIASKGSGGF